MSSTFKSTSLGYCNSQGLSDLQDLLEKRTYAGVKGASYLNMGDRPVTFTITGFYNEADYATAEAKKTTLLALQGTQGSLVHEGVTYADVVLLAIAFPRVTGNILFYEMTMEKAE